MPNVAAWSIINESKFQRKEITMKLKTLAGLALAAALAGCGNSDGTTQAGGTSAGGATAAGGVQEARVPAGSVAAVYSDFATAAGNADYKAYVEATSKLLPKTDLPKDVLDAVEKARLLDIDSYGKGWVVLSVGNVKRPADGEPVEMPDLALVARATGRNPADVVDLIKTVYEMVAPADVRAVVSQQIQIVDKDIAGVKAQVVQFAQDPTEGMVKGLAPCWASVDQGLFVAALSEGALERQILFYRDGKGEAAAGFADLFKMGEGEITKFLVPAAGRLVSSLVKDEELAMLGTLPDGTTTIASVVKGLGDVALTTGFGNGNEAIAVSVDFGSSENAQTVNGLLMAALMPLKQMASSAGDNADREAQLGMAVVNSIQVKVDGSVMTAGVSLPWKMMLEMAEEDLAGDVDDDDDDLDDDDVE